MEDLDKLRAESEALQEMFASPGWAVLSRNTKAQMENLRSGMPFNLANQEELWFTKGLMAALLSLMSLPEQLEKNNEAIEAEERGSDPEY